MSDFTKGTWSVGKNNSCVISTEINGLTVSGATGEYAVSYYGGNLICESVSANNVSLLAAAPDLYKELDALLDALAATPELNLGSWGIDTDSAKAAIAKARGGK